jgi:catechol 2,3-dioxygenase-like lactoylglutathione lyase family enzyme
MDNCYLHHVSVPTKEVAKAASFYTDVLGFSVAARPPFPIDGRWLRLGGAEVHVTYGQTISILPFASMILMQ